MFRKRYRSRIGWGSHLSRWGWGIRWTLRIFLILLIADLFYLAASWPDWKRIAAGPIPKSSFINEYKKQRLKNKDWSVLRWRPVPLAKIPRHLIRAVIVAEDSRFYEHSGFDLIAFKEAMNYNLEEGKFVLGASTISQQTVKNLFLSASRNPVRKWHELILTWGMEQNLSKRRILEIYLNIAEFGRGIYGVQAATQAYWGIPVTRLSFWQAAELAATLPGPTKHNPATRTPYFKKRVQKIISLMWRFDAGRPWPAPFGRTACAQLRSRRNCDGRLPRQGALKRVRSCSRQNCSNNPVGAKPGKNPDVAEGDPGHELSPVLDLSVSGKRI
ncbi:MAG: hypothetical protein BMS9Abin22_452 [Gammaproteobacteria bacterium]|nr:MAG: hypothetical protein BMS9Abin22_452 [Gammaproteobacteria bacterium]